MLKAAKVIFEDEWVMVVSKPSGMVVNRSDTNREGTLQDELSGYFKLGSSLGIGDRAGIVHRLDRETSGLLVVAKTQKAYENLQAQFKSREVTKEYLALVHGKVGQTEGSIEVRVARIGKFGRFGVVRGRPSYTKVTEGKEARTDYKVIDSYIFKTELFDKILNPTSPDQDDRKVTKSRINYLKQNAREYSFLSVFPKTGRTHQIRVHLKHIGHPVVSDLIYGPNKLIRFDLLWCSRLFLHASKLEFAHPKTGKSITFESGLPNDLKNAILNLKEV